MPSTLSLSLCVNFLCICARFFFKFHFVEEPYLHDVIISKLSALDYSAAPRLLVYIPLFIASSTQYHYET